MFLGFGNLFGGKSTEGGQVSYPPEPEAQASDAGPKRVHFDSRDRTPAAKALYERKRGSVGPEEINLDIDLKGNGVFTSLIENNEDYNEVVSPALERMSFLAQGESADLGNFVDAQTWSDAFTQENLGIVSSLAAILDAEVGIEETRAAIEILLDALPSIIGSNFSDEYKEKFVGDLKKDFADVSINETGAVKIQPLIERIIVNLNSAQEQYRFHEQRPVVQVIKDSLTHIFLSPQLRESNSQLYRETVISLSSHPDIAADFSYVEAILENAESVSDADQAAQLAVEVILQTRGYKIQDTENWPPATQLWLKQTLQTLTVGFHTMLENKLAAPVVE